MNSDFDKGKSTLTTINCKNKNQVNNNDNININNEVLNYKTYSNLCGLLALSKGSMNSEDLDLIHKALLQSVATIQPAFD